MSWFLEVETMGMAGGAAWSLPDPLCFYAYFYLSKLNDGWGKGMGSFCSRIPHLRLGFTADTLDIIKLTLEFTKLYVGDAMYPALER